MALPPEQIRIKRRREDDPVQTLYIQDAQNSKRIRFGEFVFQRVTPKSPDGSSTSPSAPRTFPTPQNKLKNSTERTIASPRSVTSLVSKSTSSSSNVHGIPRVVATAPGAEFEDDRRRKEQVERARLREREKEREKAALQQQFQQQRDVSTAASSINARVGPDLTSARHFHLSRSSTPARSGSATPSGVRKGKSEYAPRAVLVEKIRKLTRHRHGEEKIDKLMMDAQEGSGRQREGADVKDAQVAQPNESIEVFKPRKRPGASQAERKFRENLQRKASSLRMAERSSSKTGSVRGKSAVDNPNDWDMESDQLASELEKVALEMTGDLDRQKKPPVSSASSSAQDSPKKPATNGMKYQPRNPGRRTLQVPDTDKPTAMEVSSSDGDLSSDSEADYVYDVFVRRPRDSLMPSAEGTQLFDPSKPFIPSATGPTSLVTAPLPGQIGVVVIEEEDEELWNAYAVEDEEQDEGWNEDDEDSNAEDNPNNDYPEDEVDSDDEFDRNPYKYSYENSDDEDGAGDMFGSRRSGDGLGSEDEDEDWDFGGGSAGGGRGGDVWSGRF